MLTPAGGTRKRFFLWSLIVEYKSVGELLPGALREIIKDAEKEQGPFPEEDKKKIETFIAEMERK